MHSAVDSSTVIRPSKSEMDIEPLVVEFLFVCTNLIQVDVGNVKCWKYFEIKSEDVVVSSYAPSCIKTKCGTLYTFTSAIFCALVSQSFIENGN